MVGGQHPMMWTNNDPGMGYMGRRQDEDSEGMARGG